MHRWQQLMSLLFVSVTTQTYGRYVNWQHDDLTSPAKSFSLREGLPVPWLFDVGVQSTQSQTIQLLKPGFHYPSSRPEFTGRVDGPSTRVQFLTPVNSGRQLGWWKSDARVNGPCRTGSFLTPELTARVDGCQKMHPT